MILCTKFKHIPNTSMETFISSITEKIFKDEPPKINFDPIQFLKNLPIDLQFEIFELLTFKDISEFSKVNDDSKKLVERYTDSAGYQKRLKLKPIWMFSENYLPEIINKLQTDEKFNQKPSDFQDSLIFRRTLADESSICHLGSSSHSYLYKRNCSILGTGVIHLKSVCWLDNATSFEFGTAHLIQLLKKQYSKSTFNISTNWLMRVSSQFYHQNLHVKIIIKGYNDDEKHNNASEIKKYIWKMPNNYDFSGFDRRQISQNYFNFSPEYRPGGSFRNDQLQLNLSEIEQFDNISFWVAYCDHSNWWKNDADWAFCDLIIG